MDEVDKKNIADIEAVFDIPADKSPDNQKPAFDPNKIKMNCSSDFKDYNSPPQLKFKGKIPDGSINGVPFYVTRETGTTGKVRIEIYAKIGYGFITEGKDYIFQGEVNYEHGGIEKMKKHAFFGYDNQSYISFSLAEPMKKEQNKSEN